MVSESSSQLYSIGDVAKLTNLSVFTIRAWERRYSVVNPTRSNGGTRRYSSADLKKLQRLKAGVEAGHRIGDIAHLSEAELGNLACGAGSRGNLSPQDARADVDAAFDQAAITDIIESARELDALSVERLLNVQYRVLGPAGFRRVFCPALLTDVGNLWRQGRFPIASEHLISEVVTRLLLRSIDGRTPTEGAPIVIFATPQGESHRLGLLIAAGVASDAGAQVVFLGSNMPAAALVKAVQRVKPWAVAISIVNMDVGSQRNYLNAVRQGVPEGIEVWVGGAEALGDIEGCVQLNLAQMSVRISDGHPSIKK